MHYKLCDTKFRTNYPKQVQYKDVSHVYLFSFYKMITFTVLNRRDFLFQVIHMIIYSFVLLLGNVAVDLQIVSTLLF